MINRSPCHEGPHTRVKLTVELLVPTELWSDEYYIDPDEVAEDVETYVKALLHAMPVQPCEVFCRVAETEHS